MFSTKCVIIDNKDSFTFNIVELYRSITGESPVVVSADVDLDYIDNFDKIIFSPGPGLPEEHKILPQIIDKYKHNKHILGICLGHQSICEYFGGSIMNMNSVIHGQNREIEIIDSCVLFKGLPTNFRVGLYHSWIVNKKTLPQEIIITALSEDNRIMAVKHEEYNIFGVQFHPESHISEYGKEIMQNFIEL